jgi:hypothetical protein
MKPISEEWARTIGCITGAFTSLALVIGGGWTLYEYFDHRAYQLETARFEAIRPVLDERLKLYVDLTSAASTIATSKNEADVAKAKEQLLKLFYGPMGLISDFQVQREAGDFITCVQDNTKCSSPLPNLSLMLAGACDRSLQTPGLPPAPPKVNMTVQ